MSGVSPNQLSAGVSRATLICETTFNFPVGEVTWRRDDGVELSPERFIVTSNGELQIANVTLDDQAVYMCTVTNLYGSSSGSSTVSVLSKYFKIFTSISRYTFSVVCRFAINLQK